MTDSTLTAERILEATEDVLRRYGPAKATVVDVARELKVSHGSVYRHFPSKAALREAVAGRWLARTTAPLKLIAEEDGPAPARLRRWLESLAETKRNRAANDPQLFATYLALASDLGEVIRAHRNELTRQVAQIVASGRALSEFPADGPDPETTARAILDATARFHNPAHAAEWSDPSQPAAFRAVCDLLLRGLGAVERTIPGPEPTSRRPKEP